MRMRANYINGTVIGNYLWRVKRYMMNNFGCDVADREIDPLVWYISTGRASTEFLKALLTKKPFMIGRLLHKGGSTDEAIERIKTYLES